MIVALLSDVHANLAALEAVLADADRHDCEAVWNLGDFLGYGPDPQEVVDLLSSRPRTIHLLGNYDRKVLRLEKNPSRWRGPKSPAKYFAFQWASEQLTPAGTSFLTGLPTRRLVTVGDRRFELCHGSPEQVDESLSRDTPAGRWREIATATQAGMVCFGHTHQPFQHEQDGVVFLNPGSVGRPEGGDPRACYALLDIQPDGVAIQARRVEYDVSAVADRIVRKGLPEAFAAMLVRARNLKQVLRESPASPVAPEDSESAEWAAAQGLAEHCHYEVEHARQVGRLALSMFDQLQPLHALGSRARHVLHLAALLHDIGWIEGQRGHHKASAELILHATSLPLDDRRRAVIAAVARYHRKALPDPKHTLFGSLSSADRHTVRTLAAMLRVADGLDRSHADLVRHLDCRWDRKRVTLRATATRNGEEHRAADRKADLMRDVFRRDVEVVIEMERTS